MRVSTFDRGREATIQALQNKMMGDKNLIPFIEESKYLSATGSLACSAIDIEMKDLINLKQYAEDLKNNLRTAGKTDYPKMQSSMYAELAIKCIDYVIQQKTTK